MNDDLGRVSILSDAGPALFYLGTDRTLYQVDVGTGPDDPRESVLLDALLRLATDRNEA